MNCIIAVVSDTHLRRWDPESDLARSLEAQAEEGLDGIWHAGDVENEEVLSNLERYAPLLVVRGNCDPPMNRPQPNAVRQRLEELNLVMVHGHQLPLEHPSVVLDSFDDDVDLIIHGHTHCFRREEKRRFDGGSCWILNPGSATSPRDEGGRSWGLLTMEGKQWEFRKVSLES